MNNEHLQTDKLSTREKIVTHLIENFPFLQRLFIDVCEWYEPKAEHLLINQDDRPTN